MFSLVSRDLTILAFACFSIFIYLNIAYFSTTTRLNIIHIVPEKQQWIVLYGLRRIFLLQRRMVQAPTINPFSKNLFNIEIFSIVIWTFSTDWTDRICFLFWEMRIENVPIILGEGHSVMSVSCLKLNIILVEILIKFGNKYTNASCQWGHSCTMLYQFYTPYNSFMGIKITYCFLFF